MSQQELTTLTDDQLLLEAKKSKTTAIYDAVIIGFLFGVAVYSSVRNGFGLLSFLPLVYIPIAARNKARKQALDTLLTARNLK